MAALPGKASRGRHDPVGLFGLGGVAGRAGACAAAAAGSPRCAGAGFIARTESYGFYRAQLAGDLIEAGTGGAGVGAEACVACLGA